MSKVKEIACGYELEKKFIQEKFRERICCVYVPQSQENDDCGCGRTLKWHIENGISSDVNQDEWDIDMCTRTFPCETFGEIRMLGFTKKRMLGRPKYIRLSVWVIDMKNVWDLMTKYWKMPEPHLILSTNGGSEDMKKLSPRLTSAIYGALFKVSSSLNTWIITGGVNAGLDQFIGQAAHEIPLQARAEERELTVIGINAWGAICNSDSLENSGPVRDGKHPTRNYINPQGDQGEGKSVLDPNHTHFILVDNGQTINYSNGAGFRFKFEKEMAMEVGKRGAGQSPIVQLLIEGKKQALVRVRDALTMRTPVVVVKGSLGCADLICRCIERIERTLRCSEKDVEEIIKDELNTIRENWNLNDKDYYNCVKWLRMACFQQRARVFIYDVDTNDKEIDKVILTAILQSEQFPHKKGKEVLEPIHQLRLAMSMNRCDLAKEIIFSSNKRGLDQKDLEEMLMLALIHNQVQFVELFLEEGIVIQQFLDAERLCSLYVETIELVNATDAFQKRSLDLVKSLSGETKNPSDREKLMLRVSSLIDELTDQMVPNFYSKHDLFPKTSNTSQKKRKTSVAYNTEGEQVGFLPEVKTLNGDKLSKKDVEAPESKKTQCPRYPEFPPRNEKGARVFTEQDLFIWAVLLKRIPLANMFWRMGKEHISGALIASAIMTRLKKIAMVEGEVSLAQKFETHSRGFETMAVGILNEAYACSKLRTHVLLCRSLSMWKSNTCMALAYQFSSMELLQQPGCQTRLNRIWMGAMPSSTPVWKILLNIFFGFIFIRLIFPVDSRVEEKSIKSPQTQKKSEKSPCGDPCTKKSELHFTPLASKKSPSSTFRKITSSGVHLEPNFKQLSYWEALNQFYSAPITKFILNVVLYIVFLGVLTYFVLIDLKPIESAQDLKPMEYIVWIWCGTIIFQELRQIVREAQHSLLAKVSNWFDNAWNKFDFGVILCFLVSISLRMVLTTDYFIWVRIVYAIMLTLFFIRFMQFYFAHRLIGPKVIMVFKMMNDVFFFLCIYGVFLLAYGTLAHAMMYPNTEPTWLILKRIFYYPYWQTYGDLNLDHVEGKNNCPSDDEDCNHHSPIVIIAFAIFMLATNILLLNLLIAMFGNTFAAVQSTSERVWAYHRFSLVQEFVQRPTTPPPFSILAIIYRALCQFRACIMPSQTGEKINSPFKFHLEVEDDRKISIFEQQCMELYCAKIQAEEADRMKETAEKVDSLKNIMDDMRESQMLRNSYLQSPCGSTDGPSHNTNPSQRSIHSEDIQGAHIRLIHLESQIETVKTMIKGLSNEIQQLVMI